MRIIENKTFDKERALYESRDTAVINCIFDGPADGESALKESSGVCVENCFFNLRYPFWHNKDLKITGCEMTPLCRAALWYTENVEIKNTVIHGIKALRECGNVCISDCDIVSPEFGWSTRGIKMKDCNAESEYFMMRSDHLNFDHVKLNGKYSFQYITDSVFNDCEFDTKDAFWHAENVLVKNSIIRGEYLAWYCRNVTFENCTITGTQPLCYCKGLKLIGCRMFGCDLAFEKSEAEAEIESDIESIKNPAKGIMKVKAVHELIMDDPNAAGQVLIE